MNIKKKNYFSDETSFQAECPSCSTLANPYLKEQEIQIM